MRNLTRRLSAHIAVIIIVAIVLGGALLGWNLSADRQLPQTTLRHLTGDAEVMREVAISGSYSDSYLQTNFRWTSAGSDSSTEVRPLPRTPDTRHYGLTPFYWTDDARYMVWNYAQEHIIQRKDRYGIVDRGAATVKPTFRFVPADPSGDPNARSWSNRMEMGMTQLGESVYYIPPTSAEYTGANAIYELKFVSDDGQPPQSRVVTEITLAGNEPGEGNGPTIAILGLEAVNDQLVLLTSQDGVLTAMRYDPQSGELTGSTTVPEIRFADAKPSIEDRYQMDYEAVTDPESGMLHLYWYRYGPQEGIVETAVVSLRAGDGLEIAALSRDSLEEAAYGRLYARIATIRWLDGRQYVVRQEPAESGERGILSAGGQPVRLLIEVYEGGSLVYEGALETPAADDSVRIVYSPSPAARASDPVHNRMLERIDLTKTEVGNR